MSALPSKQDALIDALSKQLVIALQPSLDEILKEIVSMQVTASSIEARLAVLESMIPNAGTAPQVKKVAAAQKANPAAADPVPAAAAAAAAPADPLPADLLPAPLPKKPAAKKPAAAAADPKKQNARNYFRTRFAEAAEFRGPYDSEAVRSQIVHDHPVDSEAYLKNLASYIWDKVLTEQQKKEITLENKSQSEELARDATKKQLEPDC